MYKVAKIITFKIVLAAVLVPAAWACLMTELHVILESDNACCSVHPFIEQWSTETRAWEAQNQQIKRGTNIKILS